MTEVNYILVVLATIAQFILGAIWYSPLMFGKWWMQIMECTGSQEEMKKMQKEMVPFYALQFFLSLFTTISFANILPYISNLGMYHIAFWIWVGFMAPIQIGSVIWANTKKKYWLKQICTMISYSLAGLMLAALVLSI